MDDRDDRYDRDERGPVRDLERLNGSFRGGAFPRPPILPIVAILTLLVGLTLGLEIAPKPAVPPPATASAAVAAASANPTTPPTAEPLVTPFSQTVPVIGATPPPGGVTVTQAIAAAEKAYGIDEANILDAQLVDNSPYYRDPSRSDLWSWQIRVQTLGYCTTQMTGQGMSIYWFVTTSGSPEPVASAEASGPPLVVGHPCVTTGVVTVDYLTGRAMMMIVDGSQLDGLGPSDSSAP